MTAIFPRHPTTRSPVVPADSTQVFAPVSRLSVLATELSGLPLGPRADFRQELRARLLDEAARRSSRLTAGAGPAPTISVSPRTHRTGRRAAAVGLAAALVAGAATTAAAAETVPGDALYPVKRFTESVRTAVDPPAKPKAAVQRSLPIGPTGLKPAAEPRPLPGIRSAPVARPAPLAAPMPSARKNRSEDASTGTSRSSGTDRKRSADATSGLGRGSSSSGSSSGSSSRTSPVVKAPALPALPAPTRTGSAGSRTGGGGTGTVVRDAVDSLRGLPVLDPLPRR